MQCFFFLACSLYDRYKKRIFIYTGSGVDMQGQICAGADDRTGPIFHVGRTGMASSFNGAVRPC